MGIAIGVLMAVWCLSGIVMMYVPYPRLAEDMRTGGLAPIDWTSCCALDSPDIAEPEARVSAFQVEALGGRQVLRLALEGAAPQLIDLSAGTPLQSITAEEAASVAQRFSYSMGVSARPVALGLIERDQWTVAGSRRERPLHLFSLGDHEKTTLYVSSVSGKAMQVTDQRQRFWNWLGSVPHWIYPTVLRQNPPLWSQVVIWTSLVGTFLTVTGIYLGIRQFRKQRDGRWASPYRGFLYWHHIPGLIFGVFALTWVLSGLLSMNPWGLLEIQGVPEDMERLSGESPTWGEVRELVTAVAEKAPPDVVSLGAAPFGGRVFGIAIRRDGTRRRLDLAGEEHALTPDEIAAAATRLGVQGATPVWQLLTREDDYNYTVGREVATLPIVRIRGSDENFHGLLSRSRVRAPAQQDRCGRPGLPLVAQRLAPARFHCRHANFRLPEFPDAAAAARRGVRRIDGCLAWDSPFDPLKVLSHATREAHHPVMPRDKYSGDFNRRDVLAGLGASFAGGLALPASAADARSLSCVLTPVTGEGPFYFDPKLVRADITENRPGAPLSLSIKVVNAGDCKALPGTRVDVWHADAHGVYSGYENQQGTGDGTERVAAGKTFLRGTQFADGDGRAAFQTVYPSWYRGRTPHIHFKIFLGNDEVAASQIYFPDDINQQVFEHLAPYRERYKKRDTFNKGDMFLRNRTGGAFCDVTRAGEAWRATVTIGIGTA